MISLLLDSASLTKLDKLKFTTFPLRRTLSSPTKDVVTLFWRILFVLGGLIKGVSVFSH